MKRILFSVAAVAALLGAGTANAACGNVTLAAFSWQSSEAMTNVDKFILSNGYGCNASIVINGRNVLEMSEIELRDFRRQHTAMVFQRFAPLPHRWVIDNVTFGLEIRRFIKDVNHGRFLKVEAVMERGASFDSARRVTLPSGTTLDVAAKELTNSASDSAVETDSDGKPAGVISLRQITAALSSAVDAA